MSNKLFDGLVSCIVSGQVPQEEVFKVFERHPGLEEYYKKIRNLNTEEDKDSSTTYASVTGHAQQSKKEIL